MTDRSRGKPMRSARSAVADNRALPPLCVARLMVEGTVTRPLRFNGNAGEAWEAGIHEAMLKRGCLRDRAHQGQCLNCALLPQCSVWPLIAPADPTRRQTGGFVRPYVPLPPVFSGGTVPPGTRVTHGVTVMQDGTFRALWGQFAGAYVRAARQLAEWGIGVPGGVDEGPPRRGALSVAHVYWHNPVTGETQPFVLDDTAAVAPPVWYEEVPAATAEGSSLPAAHTEIVVEFVTPVRIVAAGETQRRPDLALLIRRTGERAETLCAGLKVALPPSLQEKAREAAVTVAAGVRIARDETHWEGGHRDGGLTGSITLDIAVEDAAAILPALRWAQALGVGKGAQTGAGQITVHEAR